jgi:hypothetical protein
MKRIKYEIRMRRDKDYYSLHRFKSHWLFGGYWEYMTLSHTLQKLVEYAAEDARKFGAPEYEVMWSSEIVAGQS